MRKRWIIVGLIALAIYGASRESRVKSDKQPTQKQSQEQSVQVTQKDVPEEAILKNRSLIEPILPDPAPEQETGEAQDIRTVTKFVRGKKVALRDGPGKEFRILDRYNTGREVDVFQISDGWSKVRDRLTQREGWMSSSLLTGDRPMPAEEEPQKAEPKKQKPVKIETPSISNSTIIQRIIAESISGYSGSCACPYNVDRGGRRCGKRSAYSKPGGAAPICFTEDVSGKMIEAFRAN